MGIGSKAMATVFALAGLFSTAQSSYMINNQYQQSQRKDAINQRHEAPKPISIKKNFTGGENPFKHYRKVIKTQKEYRNWMKQVPQMRRSKKCRLNK